MTDAVFLYVTAPNSETAARIGRTLVEEKLAACVNIHAEMRSVYNWEGKVEIGLETPLIVKTTSACAAEARDRIMVDLAQQHPGYGWEINAGYPTKAHRAALQNLGVTPHHRRSFKPVHNILYQEKSVSN